MNKMKILALVFFLVSAVGFPQTINIDRIIAVIGDKPVLLSEMEAQILQARAQGISLGENPREVILDQLLYQKLLLHHAEVDSVEVTEDQVLNELEARIRVLEQQVPGGRKGLEDFYGKTIQQIKDDFYDLIKDKLKAQAMEREINQGIKVTPAEIKKFFNSIPADSVPLINSMLEIAHITRMPVISDQDKLERKTELEELRQKLIKGEISWCRAALKSDDPGTRTKCGEWGEYIPKGVFVPEFDAMAFRIKEGQISEIFETSYGYHFMRLDKRKGEEYIGAHILFAFKESDEESYKASQKLDSILKLLKEDKITFEKAAALYSDDEDTKFNGGKLVNPYTGDTKFDVSELEGDIFVTIDKLKPGEISGIVSYFTRTGKQGYRILKLLKRTDPHRANLEDDYQMISNAAQNNKEEKNVEKWVASKITTTYVWVADDFHGYKFHYNWLKKSE